MVLNVDYFDRSVVSVALKLLCELNKNFEFLDVFLVNAIVEYVDGADDNAKIFHTCSDT